MTVIDMLARWSSRSTPLAGRKVVYTCLFGQSEHWNDFHYDRPPNTDFVCFTDDPTLRSTFWDMRVVAKTNQDSHRQAKNFKHRPHAYFPDHIASLYLDNTVKLRAPVSDILRLLGAKGAPIMMFRHPWRNCVYQESRAVIGERYDHVALIEAQMAAYRAAGYPRRSGLHATTMMLRRHNDSRLVAFAEDWHRELLRFSKRDQLSFDYVRRLHGLNVLHLPGRLDKNRLMKWPVTKNDARVPRNFDAARYLELNPDVAGAGIDPRFHYLHHGFSEGRVHE
ncbi:glycosyltransferase domain-containing protein [Acidisoma silvae]|uniref:DUF616 domain-containing protein n=1 Tax=Acidisoma silvae TaxID=2802396 RepID=A0A963YUE4_9PROT|nr:glycosyltransferase domain-containing protein [Acidisoma silvae]MCB8877174.1 DUF616 domain-containing protein [Acidisoma silvae]